jgi:hypothetical protein
MDLKLQNWGDDLRLPTVVSEAHTYPLLEQAESIRKPPIPFQSKHLSALKRNTWYALQRPSDRARTGLLYIWPEAKACIYISGDARPRCALLRLRVDTQFMAAGVGPTVFQATLSAAGRRLWIEDVIAWKGRNVWAEESFSARWKRAAEWLEHYCILDTRLLSGLTIEMAPWNCLDAVRPEGTWELQSDQAGQRRLYWIAGRPDTSTPPAPVAPTPPKVPVLELAGPLVAIATRDSGPDQWQLESADGVKLGRALIRKMAVSSALREAASKSVAVEVEWNAIFGKWEVRGLSDGVASHSRFFEPPK